MNRPAAGTRRTGDPRGPLGWSVLAVGSATGSAALIGGQVPTEVAVTVTRAAMDVAGVAAVGLAVALAVLLPASATLGGGAGRESGRVVRTADRVLLGTAGIWAVLVLLGLVYRTAAVYGRPVSTISGPELARYALVLASGRGMVLTAGCVAVVLGCAVARVRDPALVASRIPLVAALLGVITPTVTGHSSTGADHQLSVVTAALHAGAASLWVGGLGALVVLLGGQRALLAAALPRFSTLAGVCLAVVAVTGVLVAQVRLGSWEALVATGYGRLVLVKTAALLVLAGLGGLARRRLRTGRLPVLRWAGAELALMAVTLGLAAALTQTAPAV